jgi:hypothetical protein
MTKKLRNLLQAFVTKTRGTDIKLSHIPESTTNEGVAYHD